MSSLQPVLRRVVAACLFVALVATLGLVSAPEAMAASYSLTAKSCGTVTTDKYCTISVTFKKSGKAVSKATVLLQYKKGSKWVTEKKVTLKKGKATLKVKHGVMERTYRLKVTGKKTGGSFTVRFIPATFAIGGSGSGHGVGLSQYGAYALARDGKKAADILRYYYVGAVPGRANNPGATATPTGTTGKIKVQVFGPPNDRKTATTLSISGGGFTITNGDTHAALATLPSGSPVTVAVSGGQVRATGGGTSVTAPRLRFDWDDKATVGVAGARGAASKDVRYRYGDLQATAIGGALNVVNELILNTEYLYGVDEMPSSWGTSANRGLEALKAQVIAARTYALTTAAAESGQKPVAPACDCHIFDDTRSQNFVGASKSDGDDNKPWIAAVNATVRSTASGGSEVDVLRNPSGGFAEAVYFAASGSYKVGSTTYRGTANSVDVWGRSMSYLRHVDDPYSAKTAPASILSWTRNLSQADARKLFGMKDVKSIWVAERYAGGALKTVKVTSADGRTVKRITKRAGDWQSSLKLSAPWVRTITGK